MTDDKNRQPGALDAEQFLQGMEPRIGAALHAVAAGNPYTDQQKQDIIAAAAFYTGDNDIPLPEAEITIRELLERGNREQLNAALQQAGLEPIRETAQDKNSPAKVEPAAEAGGDPGAEQPFITIKLPEHEPEYDPEIDPKAPEFNYQKWKSALDAGTLQLKYIHDSMGKLFTDAVTPAMKMAATSGIFLSTGAAIKNVRTLSEGTSKIIKAAGNLNIAETIADTFAEIRKSLGDILNDLPEWQRLFIEATDIKEYIDAELQKPQYDGKDIDELLDAAEVDDDGNPAADSLFMQAIRAARAAKEAATATLKAQEDGRQLRRKLKENAEMQGAIMALHNDALPVFSDRSLWDAFAPGRISKMGTLSPEAINKDTGRIEERNVEKGDIIPLPAMDISYKALMLLNAILANSVENFREYFIQDGTITFYVKGVLDKLEIDPRIKNDMQLTIDRKTAGVLYLEKQFEPLLSFIGTAPDGSRYSVFNYEGYNVDSDTMTIRTPYLFRLWVATQNNYSVRKKAKEKRIAEGKKPLKKDLKPLEINTLFKGTAYKEDDTVLEIATYLTNVLLNAGKGAHKTEITFKTLIRNCPRLQEKLTQLEELPTTEIMPDGRRRNNSARYNSELRKIARAYLLIMNPDKCDALNHFEFLEFKPTKKKDGKLEFIPPTKSTLDDKIIIKWQRISPETD